MGAVPDCESRCSLDSFGDASDPAAIENSMTFIVSALLLFEMAFL
jgi:hypothetical protein